MAGVKDSSLSSVKKATSPSAGHQTAVDRNWGVQNSGGNGGTDPKTVLNNKWNEKQINPETAKDK